MKKVLYLLVCVSVVLAASSGLAYERRLGLGGDFGYNMLFGAEDSRAKGWLMGDFKLRRSISENHNWALLFNVGYGYNYDKDSYAYRTNLTPIDLNLLYAFMADRKVSPYLSLGMGVMRWDSNFRPSEMQLEKQWDPAFGACAGLDIFLNCVAALDFNVKYRFMLTDNVDMIGTGSDDDQHLFVGAGVTWYPGGGGDSDGDGVNDCEDMCPDTPLGCMVDKYGCPKDSDGDGVCDGVDKCPETPKGCMVDKYGCPKDSDGDGVCDGMDMCPDTNPYCMVDERGCPKDSDGDGVCDGLDDCFNTPPGTEVDENGCSVERPELSDIEAIRFSFDDVTIKPIPNPTLDYVWDVIRRYPEAVIVITGYTDSVGSEEYNMKLGRRRAQAAKDYLVSKGSPPGRLRIRSRGENDPVASNATPEGRAQNRRIEFRVAEPGEPDEGE
jgi:outer membrane protein OmpA-like peptidoglycan-associated protein